MPNGVGSIIRVNCKGLNFCGQSKTLFGIYILTGILAQLKDLRLEQTFS
jgi:hypothetical protein